jgi:hypothetical protein
MDGWIDEKHRSEESKNTSPIPGKPISYSNSLFLQASIRKTRILREFRIRTVFSHVFSKINHRGHGENPIFHGMMMNIPPLCALKTTKYLQSVFNLSI